VSKRVSRRSENEPVTHKLRFNVPAAIASLLIAYGLASWAINTGNLLLYGLTLFCITWAISRIVLGVRYALGR